MGYSLKDEKAQDGLESFVSDFLTDRVAELDILAEKISSKDFVYVKETAHRWKGFSKPYGFIELERLSILLEKSAIKGDIEEVAKLFDDIKSYLVAKEKFLNQG